MEYISVFEMLKIGVGPSSSHTLGPWRAAERFLKIIEKKWGLKQVDSIQTDLYGSLSLTGKGHATDTALIMGLTGADPETVPVDSIQAVLDNVKENGSLKIGNQCDISFVLEKDIIFHRSFLDFHPNGLTFTAKNKNGQEIKETFFSIGGGFIVREGESEGDQKKPQIEDLPYTYNNATELSELCLTKNKKISEIVKENEVFLYGEEQVNKKLERIWKTMLECIYIGCHSDGFLPGGLNVRRRAFDIHGKLLPDKTYADQAGWMQAIKNKKVQFSDILSWVNCFSMAVNEVNAALGRVVTAPTNGSAGVIPAVLMYYMCMVNPDATTKDAIRFLLITGVIGSIFKKGATISAAMGGCQAEIGVSSAMAAAALTELLGGNSQRCFMAAEIAMEHHLGLTCDPIKGLVQIPCIERNSMGTIKAINAAQLALTSDPSNAKISLDMVVATMWSTAKDMSTKYKETSEGGLAVTVSLADC